MRSIQLKTLNFTATYGDHLTNNIVTDVTHIIKKNINGEPFLVCNNNLGGDPIYNTKKQLVIQISEITVKCEEMEVVKFIDILSECKNKSFVPISTSRYIHAKHNLPKISVDSKRNPTCNIIMPGYSKSLTGGPLSILRVALSMIEHGIYVRIMSFWETCTLLTHDFTPILPLYGLKELVDKAEWFDFQYGKPLVCSSSDVFMATLYCTAFEAEILQKQLNQKPILYMIQDCEPFFFNHNSESAYAYASYEVPHIPIFNCWVLRDYFRDNRLSVFSGKFNFPSFTYFPNFSPVVDKETIKKANGQKKRLIVYSRPQTDRNAYEFVVSCLWKAVEQGLFDSDHWEIIGVGGPEGIQNVGHLGGKNVTLYNLPHLHQDDYQAIIRTGDIGFVFILTTGHPSIPPFDFLSAGMLLVTNQIYHRTEEMYKSISQNIFPARMSIPSVVEQFRLATEKVDDYDFRIKGASLNIPPHSIDFEYLQHLIKQ